MARHGAESHFMRPDGVYITTVLQPTIGFDPVADTQAVAASFVAPTGLAGPVALMHGPGGRVNLLGATTSWRDRWEAFKARARHNLAANKLAQQMRLSKLPPGSRVTMDTSPRPKNPDPTALATQSGWAPPGQAPSDAAAAVFSANAGDPPNQGAGVTAVGMAPQEAAAPVGLWQRILQSGLPPVVSSRAEDDALHRWFSRE